MAPELTLARRLAAAGFPAQSRTRAMLPILPLPDITASFLLFDPLSAFLPE